MPPGAAPQGPLHWDCHVHVFEADAPVAPGHYRPVDRRLPEVEALAARHGFARLVLVQPSVYGTDNAVLLRALQAGGGRHRGVAVLDAAAASQLDVMHALGVRGIRFNLVSPVGSAWDEAATQLQVFAPALRALGWHVQWYAAAGDLQRIAELQARCKLPFVLDHLAGMGTGVPDTDPAWGALARLAAAGAWVKLSGWYRLTAAEPYGALDGRIARTAGLFGPHMVWGSDWPHTSFPAHALPGYGSVWAPVLRVLGEARAAEVAAAGGVLYQ